MTFPTNFLQTVQTYQEGGLALLQNLNCFIDTFNSRFREFNEDYSANLGSSITFDEPPRFASSEGLVAAFSEANQRVLTLTSDQAKNVGYAVSSQELIFNLEKAGKDYLPVFAKSAIAQLGQEIEENIAKNANSSVPVFTVNGQGQTIPTGGLHKESGPYRLFNPTVGVINSSQQLAQIITNFRNFGSVKTKLNVYLPDTIIPPIVGSDLTQFALNRNNEEALSWELGSFGTPPDNYYKSNLLPIHQSGTLGDAVTTLVVVSTDDPTGDNITSITFSGAGTDANAIKQGDILTFQDGVGGFPNLRFKVFIGTVSSAQSVQVRAVADAASSAGSVTLSFTPPLTINQPVDDKIGINNNIVAGMQAIFAPSHKCGLVVASEAAYLTMPRLPDQEPFPTASKADEETGISFRNYYGTLFGQNQQGFVFDATWGSLVAPDYSMRIAFPL